MEAVEMEHLDLESCERGLVGPSFKCAICLDVFPEVERVALAACAVPSHGCCAGCLGQHLRTHITEGRVAESQLRCPCFGVDDCSAVASDDDVERLVDGTTLAKYTRFKRLRENPDARECPRCEHLCVPSREDEKLVLEMTCPCCSSQFCHAHSTAHPPGAAACREYTDGRELQALGTAAAGLRNCPSCGILSARVEGCVRMQCQCGTDWCWACGERITTVGWHYNPLNPAACRLTGEQVRPEGSRYVYAAWVVWSVPILICSALVAMAFLIEQVLLRIVLFVVCLPCIAKDPAAQLRRNKNLASSITIMQANIVLVIALPVAWTIASLLVHLLLQPCGSTEEHLKFSTHIPVRFFGLLVESWFFDLRPALTPETAASP